MKAYDTTSQNGLIYFGPSSQTVKHLNETRATVSVINERPMPTGNIHIYWDQNSCHKESKSNMKCPTAVVPTKADAKQDEDEESSGCRETKPEEKSRNPNAYRDVGEPPSLLLRSFRMHNGANDA